jgi:hypothetical protein
MEPTSHFNDQMDAYLLGRMPEQERAAFEQQAEQDPLLAQELRIQKEIVHGLRQARMIQLKTQLAQVPTPPLGGLASGLSTLQWVGLSAASVALVVGGIALYNVSGAAEEPTLTPLETVQTLPQAAPAPAAAPVPSTNPFPSADTDGSTSQDKDQQQRTITSTSAPAASHPAETITSTATHTRPARGANKAANLYVDLPSISSTKSNTPTLTAAVPTEDAEDHTALDKPGLGALPSGKVVDVNDIKTKPDVIIRPSDVLSYQYFDNKLYLYGSFGDAIYEVMELTTSQEGRRLYVFFKDSFYTVSKDVHDITPMKAIADPRLVAELTLLRKRKVD